MEENEKSGAGNTMFDCLELLVKSGHTVECLTAAKPLTGRARNFKASHLVRSRMILERADAILCHHVLIRVVRLENTFPARPIVYFAHFTREVPGMRQKGSSPELLVCMTKAMQNGFDPIVKENGMKSIVMRPFLEFEKYNFKKAFVESDERQKYIGFINSNRIKGAPYLYDIASEMPDRKFLVVKAYYKDHIHSDLENIEYVDYDSDIRNFYKKIDILVCPSEAESWCKVAQEAMCNGIPVLYSKPRPATNPEYGFLTTEGMQECIAYGGIGLKLGETSQWVAAIQKLDDPVEYKKASESAYKRAIQLKDNNDKVVFVKAVEDIVRQAPPKTNPANLPITPYKGVNTPARTVPANKKNQPQSQAKSQQPEATVPIRRIKASYLG